MQARRTLLDISRIIDREALVYPGDPPLRMGRICGIGPKSPYNLTELAWTTHFLTHIDAPLHFVPNGTPISEIPLARFVGPALVVDVDGPVVLPEHIPAGENLNGVNLLFKTRNSASWDPKSYDKNHVYVSAEAAQEIVRRGVNLAGIDYLSIDRYGDESYPAHRILLGGDVLILEGIDLAGIQDGPYTLIALPLKIADGDGSPVRAALIPPEVE